MGGGSDDDDEDEDVDEDEDEDVSTVNIFTTLSHVQLKSLSA